MTTEPVIALATIALPPAISTVLCTTTRLLGVPAWCGCIAMPSAPEPRMMLLRMIASAADWIPWSPQPHITLRSITFGGAVADRRVGQDAG